jgi:hypothetical protein
MGNFSDFAGKTFKLGIVINAILGVLPQEPANKKKNRTASAIRFKCLTTVLRVKTRANARGDLG